MTVIVMAHNKGGAGKTTSAVHIAGELKPTKALDLDTHKGLSIIHGLRPEDRQIPISIPETQEELVQEINPFKESEDILFIDCGGFDSDMTRTAVAFADLIVVPAKDSLTERIGLMSFDRVLGEIVSTPLLVPRIF
ncbi:putative plasmid partition protein (plasmid) [Pantoea sp. At-9b]|nr:putative plasmid partition protein [Pantoea sp. At-9b]